MRQRVGVTLFPFLSVLLSTMGILAFLAVTFLLFARQEIAPPHRPKPIEVRWVGAPDYVRPLLIESRKGEARFHTPLVPGGLTFSLAQLRREAEIVREMREIGLREMGAGAERYELWFMMKTMIPNEERLRDSLTLALHRVEVGNVRGRSIRREGAYYPILLVYPDGIETYDLVAFLVETTTRFPMGLEPMLEGWELPYRAFSS